MRLKTLFLSSLCLLLLVLTISEGKAEEGEGFQDILDQNYLDLDGGAVAGSSNKNVLGKQSENSKKKQNLVAAASIAERTQKHLSQLQQGNRVAEASVKESLVGAVSAHQAPKESGESAIEAQARRFIEQQVAPGSDAEQIELESDFKLNDRVKKEQAEASQGEGGEEEEVEVEEEEDAGIEKGPEKRQEYTIPDDASDEEASVKKNDQSSSKTTKDSTEQSPLDFSSQQTTPEDVKNDPPIALFTIANTNISSSYENLPYREKYQWQDAKAPCKTFALKVPDELAEKSMLNLCIFRPNLEFPEETKVFIYNPQQEEEKESDQNVLGHVINSPGSIVVGKIVDGHFYGQVSIPDKDSLFVVEDINLLDKLMRSNQKTLRNMLMVMHAQDLKQNKKMVYNAVVTKGSSLINFMQLTGSINSKNTFLMFSTSHNSYIAAGEPTIHVDEHGQVKLQSGSNKINVIDDGSIKINIPDKIYTFRPNGRTIVKEGKKGMEMRTLQEHEGSVAITAYTSSSTYDCVLPTPAFDPKRKGGYLCKVCLAMDESFREYYLNSLAKEEKQERSSDFLQNYLGTRIIDRVSWIFRSMDLDGDKQPDNIGLDYDSSPLNWTYPDVGEENVSEQDIELLFQSLETYNFADCCLGIGFTMKNLPNDVLGQRTQSKYGPSGVCAGRTGRIASNLIIMSANNKRGNYSAITETQLIYATANQIGFSLGAKSDENGNDDCDEFKDEHGTTRHYLMWGDVMRNTTLEEHALSSCSRTDISKTLGTCISSCFDIDRHPFCGNGIVEEGEECDCGTELSCKKQTCCFSRLGSHPCRKTGHGCTFESSGYTASPFGIFLVLTLAFLSTQLHR